MAQAPIAQATITEKEHQRLAFDETLGPTTAAAMTVGPVIDAVDHRHNRSFLKEIGFGAPELRSLLGLALALRPHTIEPVLVATLGP